MQYNDSLEKHRRNVSDISHIYEQLLHRHTSSS